MKLGFVGIVAAGLFSLAVSNGQGTITTFFATGSSGLTIDPQGNVYLTESATAKVRKISSGVLSTFAGNGNFGYTGDGLQAVNAALNFNASGVSGLAVDSSGNVYFSDSANNVVRKVDTSGVISTFAGNGTPGFSGDNKPATSAQLSSPGDIAFDSSGNLYICDTDFNRVRRVTPGGTITTFAGNGNATFSGDNGQAASAGVPSPGGIAVDSQGNVYISSAVRVRKVAPGGIITTVAGTGTRGFSGDGGPATAATLRAPIGLAVDQFSNLYIADNSNGRVRKVDAAGIITTYAGIDGNASTPLGDGGPATSAYLGNVGDLMLDSSGNLYVATGGGNGRIRKIQPSGAGFVSSPPSLSFSAPVGGGPSPSQTLDITSTGGVLNYTTSASSTGNWLSVTPGGGSTPGAISVSVNPAGLNSGNYQGTVLVTPTVAGNSPLSINVSLTVTGGGAPPSIRSSNGILNVSSNQNRLAPGTVFVIYGDNLGPADIVVASAPNYPFALSSTSVTFTPAGGGTAITARIYFTLNIAVAGILPSSIPPGTYNVRLTYNQQTSAPQSVTVVPRLFGIGTANGVGTGIAQATLNNVNGGFSLTRFTTTPAPPGPNNFLLTPAHPGDTVNLWGTGGGADLANDTGGSSGDQSTTGNFKVTINGRTVNALYAGAVGGYPGLWVVIFTIPGDIDLGCFAPVQVSSNGELSNTVNIPIAAAGQPACSDPDLTTSQLSTFDNGGTIMTGALAAQRITTISSSGTTVTDSATAAFYRFTGAQWALLHSPRFGPCTVYDRIVPANTADPATPDGSFNAGARIGFTGPGLSAGAGLVPSATFVYGLSLPAGTYAAGGKYTMVGTGGSQIGPFNVSNTFPTNFTVANFSTLTSVNRSQPFTVAWTSAGVDQVTILLTTAVQVSAGVNRLSTLTCVVPAAPGSYTIPASVVSFLQPSSFGAITVQGSSTLTPFTATASVASSGQIDVGVFASNLNFTKTITIQ